MDKPGRGDPERLAEYYRDKALNSKNYFAVGFKIEFVRANGELSTYTPDFLVNWSRRPAELIEVKYRTDLRANWKRLRPGFIAARAWAKARGATFRIATERGIRGGILENAANPRKGRTYPANNDFLRVAAGDDESGDEDLVVREHLQSGRDV